MQADKTQTSLFWDDPIVVELHQFRADHAKKYNYDVDAIFDEIQRRSVEIEQEYQMKKLHFDAAK